MTTFLWQKCRFILIAHRQLKELVKSHLLPASLLVPVSQSLWSRGRVCLKALCASKYLICQTLCAVCIQSSSGGIGGIAPCLYPSGKQSARVFDVTAGRRQRASVRHDTETLKESINPQEISYCNDGGKKTICPNAIFDDTQGLILCVFLLLGETSVLYYKTKIALLSFCQEAIQQMTPNLLQHSLVSPVSFHSNLDKF